MNDATIPPHPADGSLAQMVTRNHYIQLRKKLVSLQAATEPDRAAIDKLVKDLEQVQLAYKAAHGLLGNNALDDPPHDTG